MGTETEDEVAALRATLDWLNVTRRQLVVVAIELDRRWTAETDPIRKNLIWNAKSFPEAELTRVKRAILDLVEGDFTVAPPDQATLDRTAELSDALQAQLLKEKTVTAVVQLVSDIGKLVSGVLGSKT
jgi:hypothetical protein